MHRIRRSADRRALLAALAGATVLSAAFAVAPAGAAGAPKWTLRAMSATKDYEPHWVACHGMACVTVGDNCPPSNGCGGILAAKSFHSANGGASWTTGAFPGSNPYGIACGSTTFCVASGLTGSQPEISTVNVTKDAGASWVMHQEAGLNIGPQACPSATTCVAFVAPSSNYYEPEVLRTTNTGTSWKVSKFTSLKGVIEGAACSTATQCVAVGTSQNRTSTLVFLSVNAGASWKQVTAPSNAGASLSSLACNGLACIGLWTTDTWVSVNGGKSWSVKHTLPSGPQLTSAACLTTSECILVGYSTSAQPSPVAFLTKNGGGTWVAQSLPQAAGQLLGAACMSTTACVAVGSRYTYSGAVAQYQYPIAFTY